MYIYIALLSLWNLVPKMVAFNGVLVCDGTFYVHLYCKQTSFISFCNFFILFVRILIFSKVTAAVPIMQTIKLIWVDYNCFGNGCLGQLAHWCWITDFLLCFAFLWLQVCSGHKSGDGIWCLGQCHLHGLLSCYPHSFYPFPPA